MTVAELFASYRARVIPADASPVQVKECERAFYAAAYSTLMDVIAQALGCENEDDAARVLREIELECLRYSAAEEGEEGEEAEEGGGLPDGAAVAEAIEPYAHANYETADAPDMAPKLREIGKLIGGQMPSGYGFTLLMFTMGADGSMFYISNAERTCMIEAMLEFVKKQTS